MVDLTVSEVRFRRYAGESRGFLGWVSLVINGGLLLNDIGVKQHRDGTVFLSFPARRSRRGIKHYCFHPINRETRALIEEAIFERLSAGRDLAERRNDGQEAGRT